MHLITKKSKLWIFLGLLAIVATACSNPTSGTAPEQESDPTETTAETNEEPAEEATDPTTEEAAVELETANGTGTFTEIGERPIGDNDIEVELIPGDNRSNRLQSLTASWNTNWEIHTIRYEEILSGGPPRDGIPSVDDPQFISPEEAEEWLDDNEPVIALELNGDARAYPIQILTWHEIVNDTVGGIPVNVTFCPLCNSAIVFDRRIDGEVYEFGTSGLLRNSDLIMYDRTTETLWQQFTGEAIVGELVGKQLTFLPSGLVSFADFKAAQPDGVVMSKDTGFNRRYGQNPYVGYDQIGQNPFLYQGIPDDRLAAMERVVTVSLDNVDLAYPLPILMEAGVINDTQDGQDLVVFHTEGTSSALDASSISSGRDVGATGVFDPNLNGQKLTFIHVNGQIRDEQTDSVWNIFGQAVEGELAGEQLTPIVHADHFWFSWAAFRPDTIIYSTAG